MENTGITFFFFPSQEILCGLQTKSATDSVFKLTLTKFCHWLSAIPAWKKLDILHHMTVAQFHFSFLPLRLGSWKCVTRGGGLILPVLPEEMCCVFAGESTCSPQLLLCHLLLSYAIIWSRKTR